ncbi:hypothetical protein TNCV_3356223 [Trichonephila clavipes]|nr:hypothetical protein TNCV_3356223 [Trichonephila clavipes]
MPLKTRLVEGLIYVISVEAQSSPIGLPCSLTDPKDVKQLRSRFFDCLFSDCRGRRQAKIGGLLKQTGSGPAVALRYCSSTGSSVSVRAGTSRNGTNFVLGLAGETFSRPAAAKSAPYVNSITLFIRTRAPLKCCGSFHLISHRQPTSMRNATAGFHNPECKKRPPPPQEGGESARLETLERKIVLPLPSQITFCGMEMVNLNEL